MIINKTITPKSYYQRRLDTCFMLETLLVKCNKFKAWRKFEEVAGSTEFRYYFTQRYSFSPIELVFQPRGDHKNDFQISIEVAAKDIPSVAQGLSAYQAKLRDWQLTENEKTWSCYSLERDIERDLSEPMTVKQWAAKRQAVVDELTRLLKEVKAL